MWDRSRTLWVARQVLILGVLVFGMEFGANSLTVAHSDIPPGSTIVSSGPDQPAGQTKATVDRLRRQGKDLMGAIDLVNDLHGAVQLRNRLEELRPQIQAKMPAIGGVLVAAYVDELRVGEGSVRTLRSVQILGAYQSEKEAREDLTQPAVKAAHGPVLPLTQDREPNHRLRTTPRYFWFAAPIQMPPLAKAEELNTAREKLSRLLEVARQTCATENARLEIEWTAIQKENSRLNKARRLSKPVNPVASMTAESVRKEIEAWEAGERQAIAAEKAAAVAATRAVAEVQKQIVDHNRWRCPAGVTYEECTIHLKERQDFKFRRDQLEVELALRQRQSVQHRQAAEARESRLPQSRDARLRDLDVRRRDGEKDKEAAQALAKEQAAFQDRLTRFNEQDDVVRKLRGTVKEIQETLGRLQVPTK